MTVDSEQWSTTPATKTCRWGPRSVTTRRFGRDSYIDCAPGWGNNLQNSGQWSVIVSPISKSKYGHLPERFHDQALTGEYTNHRECHLKPDLLLIFKRNRGFYIAAGAHRFSQRSFLSEDGRSRFVVSHSSQSTRRMG